MKKIKPEAPFLAQVERSGEHWERWPQAWVIDSGYWEKNGGVYVMGSSWNGTGWQLVDFISASWLFKSEKLKAFIACIEAECREMVELPMTAEVKSLLQILKTAYENNRIPLTTKEMDSLVWLLDKKEPTP